MDGKLDIDSFEKAINGLNRNLYDVGMLFRANMELLASEASQASKENCVNKMSDRVEERLDSFRANYGHYNDFYEKLQDNIRNENIENPEEYDLFLCDIPVKTEKFDSTMRELGSIIENFRFDFKRTLAISDIYQVQKEMKEQDK